MINYRNENGGVSDNLTRSELISNSLQFKVNDKQDKKKGVVSKKISNLNISTNYSNYNNSKKLGKLDTYKNTNNSFIVPEGKYKV